jgi:meso-butanediol dehydrogenase/(S,S)-butanediol dehydrogenase/diacetyl reductase
MQADFKDKVVIVTGGSQNIGWSICQGFAELGATVISADLNPPESAEGIAFVKTDVSDEASVAALMQSVMQQYGRLDVLVNCAGICIEVPLQEMTVEQWDRVMGINVRGVFLMTKHAFEPMTAGNSEAPAIVNISSIEGLGANPLHSVYGASKAAVAAFTRNTALEYGEHGIRCNAIAPGWIDTPFNEELLSKYPDRNKVDSEIKALHPVGRLGLPGDIAATAVWLASHSCGFITGQEIVVDGGRLAKLPLPNL